MKRIISYVKENLAPLTFLIILCFICMSILARPADKYGFRGAGGDTDGNIAAPAVSVTDIPYSFVNGNVLPENSSTVYSYQTKIEETDADRISCGAGTCEYFFGKKIVALFFIDDDESEWNEVAVRRFTNNSVIPGIEFIHAEAKRWGIDLDISVWRFSAAFSNDFNFKYSGTVNPDLYNGGSTKDIMDQVASYMGYSKNMALWWALTEKSEGAEIIPIFVINKDGTSYARHLIGRGSSTYTEQAVIFTRSKDTMHDRSSTFAHELLHLYGAEDLYMPNDRYALAYKLYPEDIMCLETRNISKLKIGDFTAFALGWTDNAPPICENEKWYMGYAEYEKYR